MSVAAGYETRLRGIGDNLAVMLERLWARHAMGALTLEEFTDLAVILVTAANGQAVALARLSVAAYITAQTGVPLPVVTEEPPPYRTDPERVHKSLRTIVTGSAAVVAGRLSRLAHAEPVDAGAETYAAVVAGQGHGITGSTRQLESDACDLCKWWASESHKFPPTAKMPRHNGCACVQLPSFN